MILALYWIFGTFKILTKSSDELECKISLGLVENVTPNIALRSGSLNLKGIFDTCKRFGVFKEAVLLMSWWKFTPPNDGVTMMHEDEFPEGTSGWLQSSL